ncbi:PAS domain-containing protein [Neobacillus niacini]|uniref:helix-turn-helix transcriptional regulator n=1 Tax=Neobacillus niacini TaxID=86668 RepID=UPI0030019ABB
MEQDHPFIFDQAIRTANILVAMLGSRCEVAVHDFTNLDKSLIYLAGEITERKAGSPITDLILKELMITGNETPDIPNYKTTTKKGKILKSSTVFLKDQYGEIIGALCINIDITLLIQIRGSIQDFVRFQDDDQPKKENFFSSVNEVIEDMVQNVLQKYNKIPVQLDMDEKIDVVRSLEEMGTFLIKGSTEYLASLLGVSKFTIYNYLQKIRSENFGGKLHD